MIWSSDRAGYRSHGSWGAQDDTYIMFFDAEAYDKFRLSKEELALIDEDKEKDEDKRMIKKSRKRKKMTKRKMIKTKKTTRTNR